MSPVRHCTARCVDGVLPSPRPCPAARTLRRAGAPKRRRIVLQRGEPSARIAPQPPCARASGGQWHQLIRAIMEICRTPRQNLLPFFDGKRCLPNGLGLQSSCWDCRDAVLIQPLTPKVKRSQEVRPLHAAQARSLQRAANAREVCHEPQGRIVRSRNLWNA